jgi:hypothetical protein
MKGFVKDIEDLAVKNDEFRRVLYTAKNCQLVVMSLKPKEDRLEQQIKELDDAGQDRFESIRQDLSKTLEEV